MNGSSGEQFTRDQRPSTAPRRTSMFSNAFSMVEDMIALQQQQRAAFENGGQSRNPRARDGRGNTNSGTEGEDDDLAYGQHRLGRRKSVISRIKERLLDGKRSPRKGASASSSQEELPAPSPRIGRRANGHRAHSPDVRSHQRARTPPIHIVVEHEDESSEDADSDRPPRKSPNLGHNNLEALHNIIDFERTALRACKKKLEQASRQPNATSSSLQRVIDEIKGHELALLDATDRVNNINKAKAEHRRSGIPPPKARQRPQSYQPQHSQQRPNGPTVDGHQFPAFPGFQFDPHPLHTHHMNNVFGAHEHPDPFSAFPRPQSFGEFEHFFGPTPHMAEDPYSHFHFNDIPETHSRTPHPKKQRYSQGPPPAHRQSHQFPAFTPPPTPPSPQPPSSLLKPAEAQRLFQKYNSRWNALLPTDPAIPYPARGLQASSLSVRDSIWAPRTKTDISMWNDETVMQANAQAFYLGVVGLKPEYTDSSHGQIECGFAKSSATPEQIKQLVDLLKKEKPRWPSDRLGRRNGGVLGGIPNESLQKDERARAVFHAVCELMDRALE